MKRSLVVESVSRSSILQEENLPQKEAEKGQHPREFGWEAECSLGGRPCPSAAHVSEPCLCGCSLRTKAVLHPRPSPVSRPASQALPNLSSGRKPLSFPGTAFKSQSSQNSLKPQVNAKSQLASGDRSRASCSATPPRRLVPMGMWPQRFLNPLSKSWPEEPLHTYIPLEGSHCLSLEALSPMMSPVEGDKPQSSPPFCFK
ncbi:PREDICTED: uncharacterized protein LOC105005254 [Bison bison bison]|uniref:Uncharacterized protein LOC105005254 n=1 Tax=Bison bison bison TaxID=43346 RepID=A0A6P3JA37_BISBB|nr:PREDICTED: uncharacterized protein LOC105005254 [Bison bison bison]XP_014333921.1 PREDICTED: uncharacterized protein LOC106700866 [Bos mutus]